MTNMENLDQKLSEKERQQAVHADALARMEQQERSKRAGGHAVMAAALGYGEGALGTGVFGKLSHFAKLFCIAFAFLVPSLLVLRVLL